MKVLWNVLTFCLVLSACSGCGESPAGPPTSDAELIEAFVTEIPDRAMRKEMWTQVFVEGSAPEDNTSYQAIQVEPQQVSVDGTTATAMVLISTAADSAEGEPLEWKLQKAGTDWKLVSAPIQ